MEILKRALLDSVKWNIKWYLGSFSSSIAIFFFLHTIFDFELIRSGRYGAAIIFLSFLFRTIYQLLIEVDKLEVDVKEGKQEIQRLKTTRERLKQLKAVHFYGDAIIILQNIFSNVHFLRKKKAQDKKELVKVLVIMCNGLKELFYIRYKYKYSVCIKVLSNQIDKKKVTQQAVIETLCRDKESYHSRSVPNSISHNILDNTCFVEVLNNIDNSKKAHFLSNDIPANEYYNNSSFQIYGELPSDCYTKEDREKYWTLPYKSEIVVPITPLIIDQNADRKSQFLGYLCIDCDHVNAFHYKYDVEMLKGVADGIYDILDIYYNSK